MAHAASDWRDQVPAGCPRPSRSADASAQDDGDSLSSHASLPNLEPDVEDTWEDVAAKWDHEPVFRVESNRVDVASLLRGARGATKRGC